jgi:hypothetical protein
MPCLGRETMKRVPERILGGDTNLPTLSGCLETSPPNTRRRGRFVSHQYLMAFGPSPNQIQSLGDEIKA